MENMATKSAKILLEFSLEERVYPSMDPEQREGVVTGILVCPGDVLMYRVSFGPLGETYHYSFELTSFEAD